MPYHGAVNDVPIQSRKDLSMLGCIRSIYRAPLVMTLTVLATAACGSGAQQEDLADTASQALDSNEIIGTIQYGETSAPIAYTSTPRFRALSFTGKKGDTIDARVRSKDGDANAWLMDSAYRHLAKNDDETPTSHDARMSIILPSDGTYYIVFLEKNLRKATFLVSLDGTHVPTPPPPPEQDLSSLIDNQCNGPQVTASDWANAPILTKDDNGATILSYNISGKRWFRYQRDGVWEQWDSQSYDILGAQGSYDPSSQTLLLSQRGDGSMGETEDGCAYGYKFWIPFTVSFGTTLTAKPAGSSYQAPYFYSWGENANYQGRCYHTTAGLGDPNEYGSPKPIDMSQFMFKATSTCFAATFYISQEPAHGNALAHEQAYVLTGTR